MSDQSCISQFGFILPAGLVLILIIHEIALYIMWLKKVIKNTLIRSYNTHSYPFLSQLRISDINKTDKLLLKNKQ
ncbi:hypothetical protein FX988_02886 [Paraglaciecola mesophila]|uniref:Uncharacterized protein n=1 Tax=Paraglaciecola mesophila TaxID=197222 RepID=A0A857JMS0_9ALTE|nr:hypothetical protein FX988_02886 [Paraglaciecola mesophila]